MGIVQQREAPSKARTPRRPSGAHRYVTDKPLISVGVKGRQGVLVLLGACRYYTLIFYRGKRPRTPRTPRTLRTHKDL